MKFIYSSLLLVLILLAGGARAQVGIGTTTPSSQAVLDLQATGNDKGLLIPRMSEAARLNIPAPPQGLLVYQTNGTQPGFWYATGAGTTWLWLPDKASAADNLGNHTATGPLKYSTNDADKILFTQAMGANGPKLEHASGWLLNYYAGPNNARAGVHRFLTGTSSGWQERLRIDASGNVGIGTDTPERALDVNGSIRQTTYSSGVINLSATSIGAFDWTHGLGYQPILMLTVDQTGGTGAEYVGMSYEHLNNNTIRFRLRNHRSSAATFTLHWIRVN